MKSVVVLVFAGSLAAQNLPEKVTIEQAVQEAVDHNLNLLAERYNLSVAEARIVTARLRPNPVISAGLDYIDFLREFTPENAGGPTEWNLRTDFVLERGGKRERRIEVAEGAREVAKLQLLNTTRTLVLDIQNAFVDVLQAKDNLALARENLQAFEGIVNVNETRVRAGDLAKVELVRTQVAALQFQSAVRQGESRLRIAVNKLQEPDGAYRAVADVRRRGHAAARHGAGAPRERSRRKPCRCGRTCWRCGATRRGRKRNCDRSWRRGRWTTRSGRSTTASFTTATPMRWACSSRRRCRCSTGTRARSSARGRKRGRRRRGSALLEANVETEVRNAWTQYNTSRELLESVEHGLLEQAKDVRDTMEYSYRRGEASLVEFLDAQRAFNDARQSHNDARADYARSLYTIEAVSGAAGGRESDQGRQQ